MNVYVTGLFWVAGAVVAGALIAYLVRRYGLDEGRPDNNDAAGQAFTIVGGLHAVVVAFVLISLFDAASTVRDGSYQETQALVSASWAAESLPEPARSQVPELARQYAETVVRQEWPRLRNGGMPGEEGWTLLHRMRESLDATATPDQNDWLTNRKAAAATGLTGVYQQRQARLNAVRDNDVGVVLWFVLIAGSVIFVLLPNLFGGTKQATHIIIVSTLAATTTLLLYAIFQMQNPFAGGAKVGPEAFSQAIARLS